MYQTGDSVMIRPNISVGHKIDPELYINDTMVEYAGKVTKIKKIYLHYGDGRVRLEIDGEKYWWSKQMFVPLKQRTE